jgi:hypothetical protein
MRIMLDPRDDDQFVVSSNLLPKECCTQRREVRREVMQIRAHGSPVLGSLRAIPDAAASVSRCGRPVRESSTTSMIVHKVWRTDVISWWAGNILHLFISNVREAHPFHRCIPSRPQQSHRDFERRRLSEEVVQLRVKIDRNNGKIKPCCTRDRWRRFELSGRSIEPC